MGLRPVQNRYANFPFRFQNNGPPFFFKKIAKCFGFLFTFPVEVLTLPPCVIYF